MSRLNRQFLRDAWNLTRPYWVSEDRWRARGLLTTIVGLNLFMVYLSVLVNTWRGNFYNAIQQYNWHEVVHQAGVFTFLAALSVVTGVYAQYLNQVLQIRWRRWMTDRLLVRWLEQKAYYRMQVVHGEADNPDQRIAEDARDFTSQILSLGLSLLSSVVTLASFMVVLWGLLGTVSIPLGSLGNVPIPGFAVWVAILYAILGTWLTVKIGNPLVKLFFTQQRFEADFRYSMVRLRENTESIALYGGEDRELESFRHFFGRVVGNFIDLIKQQKRLGWFTASFEQASEILPLGIVLPRYFAKAIGFGGILQFLEAFRTVRTSLTFIVENYVDIANFQAIIDRLIGFRDRLEQVAPTEAETHAFTVESAEGGVELNDLTLLLPNGNVLQPSIRLDIPEGSRLLMMGPSGAGKSTLLRAIAGIWPFTQGTVRRGYQRPLFLPQRPYLPLGTLRDAVVYPHGSPDLIDDDIRAALAKVGLGALSNQLDRPDNWAQRLSAGEQQRLNFARVLLQHPDAIFLDEATSALDEAAEAELYALLAALPDQPTILSVGHRSTLKPFHTAVFDLVPAMSTAAD